jgi:phospholipase C
VQESAIRSLWLSLLFLSIASCTPNLSLAQSGLKRVNHIIIVMQENRSFDNYFGALPYAPGRLIIGQAETMAATPMTIVA